MFRSLTCVPTALSRIPVGFWEGLPRGGGPGAARRWRPHFLLHPWLGPGAELMTLNDVAGDFWEEWVTWTLLRESSSGMPPSTVRRMGHQRTGFHHVGQAGPELPNLGDPPSLASKVLGLQARMGGTIQDGRSLTSRDCSSQGKRGKLEDATLSDKFWLLTEQKIPQWRKHTGHQRDSCGRRSGSSGTSAWQLLEHSKQVRRTRTGPQQDTRARRSGCDGTSARQHSAQSKWDRFPL
ncbi:uncharacterized protein LOC144576598 [Callithrix jacchus]